MMTLDELQQMKVNLEAEQKRLEAAYQRLVGRIEMLDIIIHNEIEAAGQEEEMPAEESGES